MGVNSVLQIPMTVRAEIGSSCLAAPARPQLVVPGTNVPAAPNVVHSMAGC